MESDIVPSLRWVMAAREFQPHSAAEDLISHQDINSD